MINNFFNKIYCLNIDSRTDRWLKAKMQFDTYSIDAIRFSATEHEVGEYGCRVSHLNIIKDALLNNYERILIFEDDFMFINDNMNLLDNILYQIDKIDYDIFYLGASINPLEATLVRIDDNIVKTDFAYTTHAYSLNKRVMVDIIKLSEIHFDPIDVFYSKYIVSRGNSYVSNPMLAIQDSGYSDIQNKEVDYNYMVKFFDLLKIKFNI